MALKKGTNSYATQAEAETYFEDRLDVAAWNSADDDQKEQALVTATSMLDGLSWEGVAADENQPLAFPRVGSYFDPRVGIEVTLDGVTVPTRIQKATYELAYHLLNNDGLLDDAGSMINLEVSVIKLSKIRRPSELPSMVKRLIKPILLNAGSNAWWRAN